MELVRSMYEACKKLVAKLDNFCTKLHTQEYPQINNKDPHQNLWFITVILNYTLQPQHTTSNNTKEQNKMSASAASSSAASTAAAIKNSEDNR
jgi:hypothetical protein